MHRSSSNNPDFTLNWISHPLRRALRVATGLPVAVALVVFTVSAQQAPAPQPGQPLIKPTANPVADAREQMKLRAQSDKQASFDAANSARRQQLLDDSARLLELAKDLKSEVDKTNKDTLSLNVIRKAERIEKLARGVKDKMKLTTGAG